VTPSLVGIAVRGAALWLIAGLLMMLVAGSFANLATWEKTESYAKRGLNDMGIMPISRGQAMIPAKTGN